MTRSSDIHVAAPALGLASDRPPVFMAFGALLALALGLAVLSEAGAATDGDQQAVAESHAEPAQHDAAR
jgi:hypothetical protein